MLSLEGDVKSERDERGVYGPRAVYGDLETKHTQKRTLKASAEKDSFSIDVSCAAYTV